MLRIMFYFGMLLLKFDALVVIPASADDQI